MNPSIIHLIFKNRTIPIFLRSYHQIGNSKVHTELSVGLIYSL